jgi:carbon-monoxide dehydrogenase medium subunit
MLRQLEEVYYPESLDDAVRKKVQYGDAAAPIAGGTDLVNEAPDGLRCLIDITRLGLDFILDEPQEVRIGATATMQQVTTSAVVAAVAGGLLCASTSEGWPRQVRNAATIGGNLAGAGPFADTPPVMLALDARAVVACAEGDRLIAMDEFFLDYRKTAAAEGILKEVIIPRPRPGSRGVFLKFSQSPVDKALVNAAVLLHIVDGRCRRARIALGAAGRTPRRMFEAEEVLMDQALDQDLIERTAELIRELVDPPIDFRASADYRREISGVLVKRALTQLAQAS